jgi:hypothetical protein
MKPTLNCWHEPNGNSVQSSLVLHCWPSSWQVDGGAGTRHTSGSTRCGNLVPHLTHPEGTGGSVMPCISAMHSGSGPPVSVLDPVVVESPVEVSSRVVALTVVSPVLVSGSVVVVVAPAGPVDVVPVPPVVGAWVVSPVLVDAVLPSVSVCWVVPVLA